MRKSVVYGGGDTTTGIAIFSVLSYPPPLKYKIAVFLCGYICYKMNLQVQNRLNTINNY